VTGKRRVTLDLSRPNRSETWTVRADIEEEYEAIIELMKQIGFELDE
jgi:hypothetical protein